MQSHGLWCFSMSEMLRSSGPHPFVTAVAHAHSPAPSMHRLAPIDYGILALNFRGTVTILEVLRYRAGVIATEAQCWAGMSRYPLGVTRTNDAVRLRIGGHPMVFLSRVINRPIVDRNGERIAALRDLVIHIGEESYPPVKGLVARIGRRAFFVPYSQVHSLDEKCATIDTFSLDLKPFRRRDDEIIIGKDVLDRQLVDVTGRRIIRVNDVELARIGRTLRVVGVDVSARALLRRLLPNGMLSGRESRELIDWSNVDYFASHVPAVKLKVSHERIARLHPRDIARLIDQLALPQGAELIEALDEEIAADTLEEIAPDRQADLIEGMDQERAADILEEMGPDEAADLLADLTVEVAEEILGRMEPEESEDVRSLMQYPEDTAGGMMTTDYVTIVTDRSVAQTLDGLRRLDDVPDTLTVLYVVADLRSNHVKGIVSLRDLVLASQDTSVADIMTVAFHHVAPDASIERVVQTVIEYNLLEVPVLDDEGYLLGIITVDDAAEHLLPEAWREQSANVFS